MSVIALWGLPADADIALINISENRTYKVTPAEQSPLILREHRQGYHSSDAIESELQWMDALHADQAIQVPKAIEGLNGHRIQEHNSTYYVLFEFITGNMPDESVGLVGKFETLGQIAAKTHQHSMGWKRPDDFTRPSWNCDTVFGNAPIWGRWQDAPNVTRNIHEILTKTEQEIVHKLSEYGKGADRYGLIHADMRLANLLVEGEDVRLIDFDDCGNGWFMYDFAAAISFIETAKIIPDMLKAWLKGYQDIRRLSDADIAILDTLVMLRRMNLLAWIGSHIEATEPQLLAPEFARDTAMLAEKYLDGRLFS